MKRWRLLSILLLLLATGCSEKPAAKRADRAPRPESPRATAAAESSKQSATSTTTTAAETGEPSSADVAASSPESPETGETSAATSAEVTEAAPSQEPPVPAERVLLMTPSGPLLIDLVMTIDSQPYDAALRAVVDMILAFADSDQDQRPSWDELTRHRQFAYGQFGTMALSNERDRQQLIQQYDLDRDGTVDAQEVPRLLTLGARSSKSFSLESYGSARAYGGADSALFELLDWDRNGVLSADELEEAAIRISSRDADNDRIVTKGDLQQNTAMLMMGGGMSNRRTRGPRMAMLIDHLISWSTLLYTLDEVYGLGGSPDEHGQPLLSDLLHRLDENQDGRLDEDELAKAQTIEPHLTVAAHFGDGQDQPQLKLETISDQLQAAAEIVRQDESGVIMRLAASRLQLGIVDAAGYQDFEQRAMAELARLDSNTDGYLEEDEIDLTLLAPFEALDANEDGQVVSAELVSYYAQQGALQRSQLFGRAGTDDDALLAALDSDYDGQLTEREIDGAGSRLLSLDRNADGRLTASEVPTSLVVLIGRGAMPELSSLPAAGSTSETAAEQPGWYVAMDSNSDGEISRREFLGTLDQFQHLDRDDDGFITKDEVGRMKDEEEVTRQKAEGKTKVSADEDVPSSLSFE